MRFVLYTEKSVAQCMAAINERLHSKSSKGTVDGWVGKDGRFALSLTGPVVRKFTRRTVLTAQVERQNGITVVTGNVPSGVPPRERTVVFVGIGLGALLLIGVGQVLLSVLLVIVSSLLYLSMKGDYEQHQSLVGDIKRILKATEKAPKLVAAKTSTMTAPRATTTNRAVSPKKTSSVPKAAPKPSTKTSTKTSTTANRAVGKANPASRPAVGSRG